MSIAQCILKKHGYKIVEPNGKRINFDKGVDFNINYESAKIQEGKNYFSDYLIDKDIFKNNFCVTVPINIIDVEEMGYKLISIDIRYADNIFNDLTWINNQKKIYLLWIINEGVPNNCMTYSKIPNDIQVEYSLNKKTIILKGHSVGPKGYKEYYVGD